jgi:hypothetical protein
MSPEPPPSFNSDRDIPLLARGNIFDIVFASYFVRNDKELSSMLIDTWKSIGLEPAETGGLSFWIRTK